MTTNARARRVRRSAALVLAGALTLAGPVRAQEAPRVTLELALRLIDAAQREAASKNLRLSFAVVDARGDLVALARMPGANAPTADTAIGKAMLSAFYGQPSAALVDRASSPVAQMLNDVSGGRLRFFQGALPIVRGGLTIGSVAASGASSQQDEDAVRTALASLAP